MNRNDHPRPLRSIHGAIVIALLLCAHILRGGETPSPVQFTVSVPVLHLRAEPDRYARSVGTVMEGALVRMVQLSDRIETLDGRTGPWVKIRTEGGLVGYAFIGWLETARPGTVAAPSYVGTWVAKSDPALRLTLRGDGTYQLRFSLCEMPGYLTGTYRARAGTVTIFFKAGAMDGKAGDEESEAHFDAADASTLRVRAALGCAPRAGEAFIKR